MNFLEILYFVHNLNLLYNVRKHYFIYIIMYYTLSIKKKNSKIQKSMNLYTSIH